MTPNAGNSTKPVSNVPAIPPRVFKTEHYADILSRRSIASHNAEDRRKCCSQRDRWHENDTECSHEEMRAHTRKLASCDRQHPSSDIELNS